MPGLVCAAVADPEGTNLTSLAVMTRQAEGDADFD